MKKLLIIWSALATVAATPVLADEAMGGYVGGGVGQFNVEIDDVDDVDTTIDNYDSDDTAYKVFAGWRLNRFLAIEGAYVNLGNPSEEVLPGVTVESETDGFAPYVVGTVPIGIFEVFAKAGYYFYDQNVTVRTSLGDASSSDSGETFTWSAGVGVNLIQHLNLRLEYEQFDIEDTDDSHALWVTAA